MRYFIIAGEASGDLHGSNLVRSLKKHDHSAVIECWGGDLMQDAGATLLKHYRDTAFMGFVTVLLNLRTIARNLATCKNQVKSFKPDVVILIDYPGFNLRIAEFCKTEGIRVFYYISPKLWAWKESRVKKVRSFVDRMFIIFPFEKEFYAKHGIETEYLGNPLVDETDKRKTELSDRESVRKALGFGTEKVITILAGSRKHEVKYILPAVAKVIPLFSDYRFVLAAVPSIPGDYYRRYTGGARLDILVGKTYELFSISDAAIVKSGTSTLEAALFGVPQVVVYAGDSVSFAIARRLVKVRFISLVNLILQRESVRELIQFLMTPENISTELKSILPGGGARSRMLADYSELSDILGPAGASDRIAGEMVKELLA